MSKFEELVNEARERCRLQGFTGVAERVISTVTDGAYTIRVVQYRMHDGGLYPYVECVDMHHGVAADVRPLSSVVELVVNLAGDSFWTASLRPEERAA